MEQGYFRERKKVLTRDLIFYKVTPTRFFDAECGEGRNSKASYASTSPSSVEGRFEYQNCQDRGEQMVNRQFDVQDIFNLAWQGAIRKAPEYDIKFRTWEYVVEGTDIDGARLEVVFAVDESRHVTLITGKRL